MVVVQSLTTAERVVATALNTHITNNDEVSLTDLAEECHVAKSTVVKTLQKIGFRGYQEFSYNFRISRDVQRGTLLPRDIVVGDEVQIARELAQTIQWCESKKNIVFLGGRRMGALLASYVSRKLAMFDIFAPASYDYAMVNESRLERGAAFFFSHRLPQRNIGLSGTGEAMIETARDLGYRVVAFCDTDDSLLARRADFLVRITDNSDPNLDLFATKTIMMVEQALAQYASLRKEAE